MSSEYNLNTMKNERNHCQLGLGNVQTPRAILSSLISVFSPKLFSMPRFSTSHHGYIRSKTVKCVCASDFTVPAAIAAKILPITDISLCRVFDFTLLHPVPATLGKASNTSAFFSKHAPDITAKAPVQYEGDEMWEGHQGESGVRHCDVPMGGAVAAARTAPRAASLGDAQRKGREEKKGRHALIVLSVRCRKGHTAAGAGAWIGNRPVWADGSERVGAREGGKEKYGGEIMKYGRWTD
ncbi:hypothetical protein B0H17DRAFT_1150377 [Mycena rosella]|uniref:Uncharacterized protein n=1 Tax=Mycena rosella TaxID=1033263 RepID=A0AAD7BSW2_MYCRO|nr:hypothetical protein B0H17DRAFT_1150377 [Mycena rosella]